MNKDLNNIPGIKKSESLQKDLINVQSNCDAEVLFRKKDFELFWIAQQSTYL